MKIILQAIDTEDASQTTVEKDQVIMLETAIEMFESFLKAAGFCFDGHLEIAEDEDE